MPAKQQRETRPVVEQMFDTALSLLDRAANGKDPRDYRDDAVGFARNILNIEVLTDEQIRILERVSREQETNIPAAHAVGKSFLGAVILLWGVMARGNRVISTAPTKRQVETILWGEVAKWANKDPDLFEDSGLEVLRTAIVRRAQTKGRGADEILAHGFTARHNDTTGFQGQHYSGGLLVLVDEASGISPEIAKAVSAVLGGGRDKVVRFANPTDAETPFHKSCKERPSSVIKIPCFDHPNVKWAYHCVGGEWVLTPEANAKLPRDPDGYVRDESYWPDDLPRDVIPGAVSLQWIEDVRKRHGTRSPYWRTRVLAEFPESDARSLISRALLVEAYERYQDDPQGWDKKAKFHQWQHGMDVAESDDPHAIASRRGPVLYGLRVYPTDGSDNRETRRATGYAQDTLRDMPGVLRVDTTGGYGNGIVSNLKDSPMTRDKVVPFNFGSSPEGEDGRALYDNLRAEGYYEFKLALERGEIVIAIEDEHEREALFDELSSVRRADTTRAGKVRLEPKDAIKARIGRSTDRADAVVMAYAPVPADKDPASADVGCEVFVV